VAAFAALCYGPLLLTAPGAVVADTKSYLYIDPGRLLARAGSMWDPHVGMGTVTHQNIGFLWPMGPYYWFFERLGAPDWVAQRLWLGSILFFAGLGVLYLLRTFSWRGPAVGVAMLAYALTPYTLSVAARISALLLSFSALPWLIAFAVRGLRRRSWRHPALFALTVTTVGTSNATAILLAGVAPVLWFPFAVWVTREAKVGEAVAAMARIGVLTLLASAWWIVGLSVQATNGIDVLAYTETARVVAAASLSNEVLRGIGYWFFYGGDRLGPWIEPSVAYTQRLPLLAASYVVPSLGLLGGARARWRERAYFVGLLLVGTVLAVGAHPWGRPSLVGRGIKRFLGTSAGLAMRSLPRADPLIVLALAVLLGAGVHAYVHHRPERRWLVAAPLAVLIVLNFVPLWTRGLVPQNLRRPSALPSYWLDAGRFLDETDDGTRVLEIPGSDFSSYRWGNTVDPITPGLTDRPFVARELVPSGSAQSADVLNAFDLRLQSHVAEPASFAPMARIMRTGQVLVRSDLQFERYNTPRPRELWDLVRRAAGLGPAREFGPIVPNVPVPDAPLDDELALSLDPALPDPPPVAVLPVDDPVPIVAAKPVTAPVLVAGDGAGLVDATAAGLLDGAELLRYSASMTPTEIRAALDDGAALLLTDSNRRRGERWGSIRNTRGYTEPAGLHPLQDDPTDNRLPVFPDAGDDARTVALQHGIEANATSYGNPSEYTPEDRPANAVDGDPRTAWRTGDFSQTIGEHLVLTLERPITTDSITLLAPTDHIFRWITKVRLRFDGTAAVDADLGDASRTAPGQRVDFPARAFRTLDIEVLDDTLGRQVGYGGARSTGFAEVEIGDRRGDEVVRLPTDLLAAAGGNAHEHALDIVMTRLRSAPTETLRDDEELAVVRSFDLPGPREFTLSGTARLSPRIADDAIDRLLGIDGGYVVTSSARLGGRAFRASAAVDGDPATAWSPRFGEQVGQWVDVAAPAPVSLDHLSLTVLADGRHSVPTRLRIEADGQEPRLVDVPGIGDAESPNATATVGVALGSPLTTGRFRVVIDAVRPVTTINWYTGKPETMPVGIAELGAPGVLVPPPPARFSSGCRSDLLRVDGRAIAVAVTGTSRDAIAGEPLAISPCADRPAIALDGDVELRAAPGRDTGIDLDRLVLRSAAGGAALEPGVAVEPRGRVPALTVAHRADDRVDVRVAAVAGGGDFWLSFGQSYNTGWQASIDGADLGGPTLVDGYANGWRIDAGDAPFTVTLRFAPQARVNAALWLSALGALLCIALAVLPVRRRARPVAVGVEALAGSHYDGARPSARHAVVVIALLTVAGAALANVLVGLIVGAVAAWGLRDATARRWIALSPPAALLAAGAYVIAWQVRFDIPPGFDWPTHFDRAHPLGWLAVLLLLADLLVRRSWTTTAWD